MTSTMTREEWADLLGLPLENIKDEATGAYWLKRPVAAAYHLSDLRKRPPQRWVLPGVVPEGFVLLYGKPKTGKSWFAIELALCMASTKAFHGTDLGKHGRVLYVASEGGGKALVDRIDKIVIRMVEGDADGATAIAEAIEQNLRVVECGIGIDQPGKDSALDQFLKENPGPWAMVIIDTLARNMLGDESNTMEMNDFIKGCDRIREKFQGADMIVIHHEPWDKNRPRGASALFGAVEGSVRVASRTDGGVAIRLENARNGAPQATPKVYTIEDDGLRDAAPIASPAGMRALDLLSGLCRAADGPVSIEEWRKAVITATPPIFEGITADTKGQNKRSAMWNRMKAKLLEANAISIEGDHVQLYDAAQDFAEGD
jgi:hypothetical protein